MNCRVYAAAEAAVAAGDMLMRVGGGGAKFSHESDHDLAVMVRDFLENGSSGADAWCNRDSSDCSSCDLFHLADKIAVCRHSMDHQYERDLLSVVHSLILSLGESELGLMKTDQCNGSCIRFSLAKLLRSSGYDAAVCRSRWQGCGKVPGGDHQYIDVIKYDKHGTTAERLVIDIDFRSHFEIARAVESYNEILKSLPVVYVGSFPQLKKFLLVMAEAARTSLKQNSMPLPPWRSLAYLQAKWDSAYRRLTSPTIERVGFPGSLGHNRCDGHLRRLQWSLQSDIEEHRLLKQMNIDVIRTRWKR